jgi:peroxiredoxin
LLDACRRIGQREDVRRSLLTLFLSMLTLGSALVGPTSLRADDPAIGTVLAPRLVDVRGQAIDVKALAQQFRLVFVTLKATWCPVCQAQLERLGQLLPRLRSCGASFIVLAPGPREAVEEVAVKSKFPYPFVADVDMSIAASAGLQMPQDQLQPAIFTVNAELEIDWIQRGRSRSYFGDGELVEHLECPAFQVASSSRRRHSNSE